MQFGLKIDFFKPFETFKLQIKEVKYTVYQKLITTIVSVVVGCESAKDINEKLDSESIDQLSNIHHQLFMENSN